MSEAIKEDTGTLWDAPNQQVVRADASGPWDEGSGGTPGNGEVVPGVEEAGEEPSSLEAMTKEELIAYAQERGISPANASMNKADLIASIEAAGG